MHKRPHIIHTQDTAGHSVRPRPLIPRALRQGVALAIAGTALTAATAAPGAWAAGPETFCVHQAGYLCPAGSIDQGVDLQAALSNADANSVAANTPNVVDIGPGTYTSPGGFRYVSTNPIRIVGAGAGLTTLTAGPDSASGTHVLAAGAGLAPLSYTAATVSGLTLDGVNANGTGLMLVNGAADHVAVTDSAASVTGLNLQYSTVKTASVSVPDTNSVGVLTRGSRSEEVDDLSVSTAGFGVRAGTATTLVRAHISAGVGVQGTGGDVRIDDSLVRASDYGLVAFDTAGPGSIHGGNDTIVRVDNGLPAASYGVYAQSTAGNGADVGLVNSIIHGFTFPFGTDAQSGSATIEQGSNNYDGNYIADGVTTTQPIAGDPGFVDPAHGDYHLAASSPLVDAVGVKYVGSLDTDLDGNPRVVAVDHPGTPVDLGAYEYQPPANAGNPGGGTPGGGTPGGGTPGAGTPGTGNPGGGNGTPAPPSRGSRPAHPPTVRLIPLGHLAITGNRISLRLSCTGTAACAGIRVTATATGAHHRRITVGSVSTRLAAGHRATLAVSLNRAGRALLTSGRRLRVTLVVTVRSGTRTQAVETAHVTLHRLP